jgi:hypothetical protein
METLGEIILKSYFIPKIMLHLYLLVYFFTRRGPFNFEGLEPWFCDYRKDWAGNVMEFSSIDSIIIKRKEIEYKDTGGDVMCIRIFQLKT